MQYTYLGKTGLQVSKLCLGTMSFGPLASEEESFAIMDRALELGINFFDTANVYGNSDSTHHGLTEEIIGRWFAQGGNRRERVILATKVHERMKNPLDGPNDEPGLSAYKIYRHLEESLKRLQTDHVELYIMHHVDYKASWNELFGAFENIINQGKAYYVGSSNFGARHLAYAKAAAEKRNFLGIISEQHKYNLTCRLPELEVLPAAQELGMGITVWAPLEGGLLAENALNPESNVGKRAERLKYLSEDVKKQVAAYAELCKELGERESDVSLAWLLHNPAVSSIILGPRTVEQLEKSMRALEIELSEETLRRIDEIFPGPGKAAPEAYAW